MNEIEPDDADVTEELTNRRPVDPKDGIPELIQFGRYEVVGFLGQGSIAPENRLRADIGVFVALGAALVGGFVLWLVLRGVWDLIGVS